ncbi:MAG TPA: hypothetical protein VEC17_01195 [Candidatus Binatia bacterium]|nr:hypothetical protein [Candidatus Binatia bacterium]
MAKKIFAVVLGFILAPAFIHADFPGLSGAFGTQLVGDPCAVRIYHTNFNFPPEGGRIIMVGQELYFIRTYRLECANTGSQYPTVASSTTSFNPLQVPYGGQSYYVNPSLGQQQTVPVAQPQPAKVAPATGTAQRCY